MKGFHSQNGFCFTRGADGSVTVEVYDVTKRPTPEEPVFRTTLPVGIWGSVVSSMSARGENFKTWQEAQEFHTKKTDIPNVEYEVVAMTAVTSVFCHYMNPENRSPSWTPACMLMCISETIQKIGRDRGFPEYDWLIITTCAFKFYEESFKLIMDREYERIWRQQ